MNNTFCIKRFALYASKHYLENRLYYLLLIGISFLAIILIGTEFSFFSEIIYKPAYSPLRGIEDRFKLAFCFVGISFIIAVVSRSASGTKGDVFKMKDILLPVSFQERFWFIIFNSIIVATIVYLIVFYIASSYAESLYLFGDEVWAFKGLLPIHFAQITPVEAVENRDLFSIAELFGYNKCSGIELFGISTIILSVYLYCIAVIIWGSITFNRLKGFRIPITILSHISLIAAMTSSIGYIANEVFFGMIENHYGLNLYFGSSMLIIDHIEVFRWSPILLIPSFIYFFVVWKKLKTLEVYN